MVAGTKYEYNKVQGSDEQTDGGTAASAVDDDDHEPVTVEIPPKQAGAPLGIGLTSDSGSCLDRFLSYFVDVPPPQLVVVQISPESPAAGLLQPGDVISSGPTRRREREQQSRALERIGKITWPAASGKSLIACARSAA